MQTQRCRVVVHMSFFCGRCQTEINTQHFVSFLLVTVDISRLVGSLQVTELLAAEREGEREREGGGEKKYNMLTSSLQKCRLASDVMTSSVGSSRQSPSARRRMSDKQNSIGPVTTAVRGPTSTTISARGRSSEPLAALEAGSEGTDFFVALLGAGGGGVATLQENQRSVPKSLTLPLQLHDSVKFLVARCFFFAFFFFSFLSLSHCVIFPSSGQTGPVGKSCVPQNKSTAHKNPSGKFS